MKQKYSATKSLVQQEIALDGYLSKLLEEIPTFDGEVNQKEKFLQAKSILGQELENRVEVPSQQQSTSPLAVMPDYSQKDFQALFFRVGQLLLATPLTGLLRTTIFNNKLTTIPGQADWFLGLIENQDTKVGVLDTEQLILGNATGSKRDQSNNTFNSLILTLSGNWGFACDEVLSIAKVEPVKVRWRTHRRNKPWLIGTIINELAAIIDINELVPKRCEKTKKMSNIG